MTQFKTILGTASHDLESMDDLHINAAVLSRLIYRMKCKFRSDKGLRYMIKLNKALLNYYNMSLNKDYTTLRSQIQMEDGMYILPSRQSLEYVLARTQGFGKLMTRIEEISKCASHLLKARMELGHAWKIALMAYATTSRIWYCPYKRFVANYYSHIILFHTDNNTHFLAGSMQKVQSRNVANGMMNYINVHNSFNMSV